MNVLVLNQTFYPDVAATAQHMWDLATYLDQHGHNVCAVTSRSIYGTDQHFEKSFEQIGRVQIHRVSGTAFGKASLPGRMCDFLSFYAAAFWKLCRLPSPDVVLALTSPPMIASLGAMQNRLPRWGRLRRPRLVYHVMDLYPDAAAAMGVLRNRSLFERSAAAVTGRTLRASDAVIALGRDMADRLLTRYRVPADRLHIVPPWADGDALSPLPKTENPIARSLGVQNSFNIVYSGNLGLAHDLDTITSAIGLLRNDTSLAWLFIGGGKRFEKLKEQAAAAGWNNVRFLPYQDRVGLRESLSLADVHLVSQLPAFTGILVPSKLYGIMAVGRPAIMIGPPDVECSRVIEENGAGFVVPNGASNILAQRLRQLRDDPQLCADMGSRSRRAFETQYDRPIACGRLQRILESVVER